MKPYLKYRDDHLMLTKNWEQLINMTPDAVEKLAKEWDEVEKQNNEIRKENHQSYETAVKSVKATFDTVGVRYTKPGRKLGTRVNEKFFEAIREQLRNKYIGNYYTPNKPLAHYGEQIVNGIHLSVNRSPNTLLELYANLKDQYNRGVERKNKNNERFAAAMKIVIDEKLDVSGCNTTDEIVAFVNDLKEKEYRLKELADGTEIGVDDNLCECESYTMGDRRCSCGNRRIDVRVEGNFFDGFYHYAEGY